MKEGMGKERLWKEGGWNGEERDGGMKRRGI